MSVGRSSRDFGILAQSRPGSTFSGMNLFGPLQMLLQEPKGSFAMDLVRPVEELDFGSIADAHLIVELADLCIFEGHPFIQSDRVIVSTLHHERAGSH